MWSRTVFYIPFTRYIPAKHSARCCMLVRDNVIICKHLHTYKLTRTALNIWNMCYASTWLLNRTPIIVSVCVHCSHKNTHASSYIECTNFHLKSDDCRQAHTVGENGCAPKTCRKSIERSLIFKTKRVREVKRRLIQFIHKQAGFWAESHCCLPVIFV